jgi:hypothetical protein
MTDLVNFGFAGWGRHLPSLRRKLSLVSGRGFSVRCAESGRPWLSEVETFLQDGLVKFECPFRTRRILAPRFGNLGG